MRKIKSDIPFNYATIKITKSRIDKGLLSIPVSLLDYFPKHSTKIVLVDENGFEKMKAFTPYKSSSRECRIGGLSDFYERFKIKDGDELVIQFLDSGVIKLLPEHHFKNAILSLLSNFENAVDEKKLEQSLDFIEKISNSSKKRNY